MVALKLKLFSSSFFSSRTHGKNPYLKLELVYKTFPQGVDRGPLFV